MYMMNSIIYVFTLQLAIIQLDIAIISCIFSELASIPTIYILLKNKEFVDEITYPNKEKETELYHYLIYN